MTDRAFTCFLVKYSFKNRQSWIQTLYSLVDVPSPGNKLDSPSSAYICCCYCAFAVLVSFLCRFWNTRDRSRTTRWSSKSAVLRQNSRMSLMSLQPLPFEFVVCSWGEEPVAMEGLALHSLWWLGQDEIPTHYECKMITWDSKRYMRHTWPGPRTL